MSRGLPKIVKDNLSKCQASTIAAVTVYNRPGGDFRTAQFLVLITIAWTALFHALFYRRNLKPWHSRKTKGGTGTRYMYIDGEPKHWELAECLKQHYGSNNPPERKNLEFLIGLRNKIEHRHLPELDASLYGECQAALMNLEDLLEQEFGAAYGLSDQLAVSLQFSRVTPAEKKKVAQKLAATHVKEVVDYIEKFRGGMSSVLLDDQRYSFSVFLVPKVANRKSVSEMAVEFVDSKNLTDAERERMQKLNVLIKEKHIPISNLDLFKPGQVLSKIQDKIPYRLNMSDHTEAWRLYDVRPASNASDLKKTKPQYCVYDEPHEDYLYTQAWIDLLAGEFTKPERFKEITGRTPIAK